MTNVSGLDDFVTESNRPGTIKRTTELDLAIFNA